MLSLFNIILLASSSLASRYPHYAKTRGETPSGLQEPIVDLGYTTYRGERLGESGVDQYLGMRYAAPPLGELRFRAPQDPIPESGIQNASSVNLHYTSHHIQSEGSEELTLTTLSSSVQYV